MNGFFKHIKYLFLFFFIAFIVYLPTFNNGFVWDDVEFIVNNTGVHHWNIVDLFGFNLYNTPSFYRPVHALYNTSLYSIFGQQATFNHFIQLILHVLNTYLLFLLLCMFFSKCLSVMLSLLFLIHPINVESVAYINTMNGILPSLFVLTVFLLSTTKRVGVGRMACVTGLMLCGILTKEAAVLVLRLACTRTPASKWPKVSGMRSS